jgi:hypothetical protein
MRVRDVRRLGHAMLEFTSSDGDVLRVVADSLGPDEATRVRERLLAWLVRSGIRLVEGTRA